MTILAVSDKVTTFNEYFTKQSKINRKAQKSLNEKSESPPLIHGATPDTKNHFTNFLRALNKTSKLTNHTLAFENAFNLIEKITKMDRFQSENATPLLLLYVSRGILSEPSDVKEVLKAIAIGQSRLMNPIVINTCTIILGEFL